MPETPIPDPLIVRFATKVIVGTGWFLLLVGIMTLVLIQVEPERMTVGGRPGNKSDAWGCLAIVGFGLALAAVRHHREIHVARRRIVTVTGWWRWCRRRSADLGEWIAVEIASPRETGVDQTASFTITPVRIIGSKRTMEVAAPTRHGDALELANGISKSAGIPLRDLSR